MNKRLIGITILAVLVSLVLLTANGGSVPSVYASKLAGIIGAGSTGVQVQNLDPAAPTDITMDLYPQGGGAAIPLTAYAVPAGGSANFYLPTASGVPDGAYAAIVSAVKPIAAIARTDWPSVGGAATYGNVPPSMSVLLPLAVKAYYGQTSQFSVQNTDTGAPANITIKVYASGASTPITSPTDTVSPGTSKTYDLASSTQFDTEVPNGFLGSIVITGDKPLAVQSFVDVAGSKAVYAFSGVDSASAATKLFAPLVRRDYYGTTGISIVNPNAVQVSVHISFIHTPGSPDSGDYSQDINIPANSSAAPYQGAGPMPAHWIGSAVLDATGGPIAAMVNDSYSGTSAAYNAPSPADGGKIVSLPLIRNKHTSSQLTTGVQVMNVGTGATNVTVQYKTSGGTPYSEGPVNIPQYGSYTFYTPAGPFPVGQYGSATIMSDLQNVVVIVNDASVTGAYDAAIYNGIKAD